MIYPDVVQAWVEDAVIPDANTNARAEWAAQQTPGDIHRLVHDCMDGGPLIMKRCGGYLIIKDLTTSTNVDKATLLDLYVRHLAENMHAPADSKRSRTSDWREIISLMHHRLCQKEHLKLGFQTYGFDSKYGFTYNKGAKEALLRQKELRKKRIDVAFKITRRQAAYTGTHMPERRYVLHRGVIRHSFPLWAEQQGYAYEPYLF